VELVFLGGEEHVGKQEVESKRKGIEGPSRHTGSRRRGEGSWRDKRARKNVEGDDNQELTISSTQTKGRTARSQVGWRIVD